MTLECIRSVYRETQATHFELIVLDNASADGSRDAVEREFSGMVHFVPLAENIGFAAGNNRAASFAQGDFLLLLNPDTIVLDGAIDRLMGFASRFPDAGIWGGRTLFGNGALNPASCWGRQTVWSLICQATGLSSVLRKSSFFNPEGLGGWDRIGMRQVDIVSGCFLLVKRNLWTRLDGFREIFFMYGEEADLCLRAHQLGAQPMVTSEATIVHYGGASEKVRVDKMVKLLKAKSLLIHLHFPKYLKNVGKLLLAFWPISRYLAHAVLYRVGWSSSTEKSEVWLEVVHRRGEWLCM